MSTRECQDQAEVFHRLHAGPAPLVLVNAWDAGSARIIEHAGASAIATTSAGMAWSLGYRDGERATRREIIEACGRICRAVRVPVSVDVERGFGHDTEGVCRFVRSLLEMGVVGINIEDGCVPGLERLEPPAVLCERIAATRALATRMGVRLFINARTDTYVLPNSDGADRYDETVSRATMFMSAGADGLFVPGLDLRYVPRLVRDVHLPLNIYAGGGWEPPVHALRRVGVRRISLGCGPLQAAFGLLRGVSKEATQLGSWGMMNSAMLPASEVNGLFPQEPPAIAPDVHTHSASGE